MKIKKLLISAASLVVSIALCATVGISKPELHAHAFGEYQGPGKGDANHDGKINLEDAVILQKYMVDLYDGFLCWTCADITGSDTPGKCIDLDDVVEIQRYAAKLYSECGQMVDDIADIKPQNVDKDTIKKIETAYEKYKPISDSDKEEILKEFGNLTDTYYYDELSNGILIVRTEYCGAPAYKPDKVKRIGKYIYHYSDPGEEKYLLIGDRYIAIDEAYNEKLISDKVLDELAFKLHMSERYINTIDEEFEDNCVIVCLDKETSKKLAVYEPSFFGIEGITEVRDLTDDTRIKLLEQRNNPDIPEDKRLDEDNYTQILFLTLSEHSKENVLKVIEELLKLDFVMYAEPNHIHRITLF